MTVRAVVFDLGNTLWFQAKEPDLDRLYGLEAAMIAPLLDEWGIPPDAPLARIQEHVWTTAEQWWRDEFRRGGQREADIPAIVRETAARYGITLTPEQSRAWWQAAWTSVVEFGLQLFPDVIDVLRELRAMGITIGINSNRPCTGDMQMPGLHEIGIGEYVDVIVCSGDTGFAKPHSSTFELILTRLGIPAAETMMVGDSCAMDIAGAKALGMQAVLKLNGRYDVELCGLPDYSIHDLGELLALPPFDAPAHAAAYAAESLTPHDDENEQRY